MNTTTTLPSEYQAFIHTTRYARWLDSEGRRERWPETVQRYVSFFKDRYPWIKDDIWNEIYSYIHGLQVMPSMRCLMTAGPALDRDHVAGYNCAFGAVDNIHIFSEFLYILMCGCGVGFSVERQHINKLPELPESLDESNHIIAVEDDRIGWARALHLLISCLYSGEIPGWDLSRVRPAGARLQTFGGRASGPEPLENLFKFCVATFAQAVSDQRRRLTSLECHDLVCRIGEAVVSGGVRRAALISLSNLSDDRMRSAKNGNWSESTPWRSIANNSAVYADGRPSTDVFLSEWTSLYSSKSGERGIYNIRAAQAQARRTGRRNPDFHFGCNPCSEIILRPNQFCNLSEIVVRPADSLDNLLDKARVATILGTLQSTLTEFRFLRPIWSHNCEDERLLGVSLTGIMDQETLSGSMGTEALEIALQSLKECTLETNREWSEKLSIGPSASITCVKPSGTVSQLVDSASGIHTRYARHYIRRVQLDRKDAVCSMLVDQGFPCKPLPYNPEHTMIFEFPMKAPEHAILRHEVTAIEQLELWLTYQDHWCEHKPSATIYVREHEWMAVGAWVYENFDKIAGVSFLPYVENETIYAGIAPYEEINELEYKRLAKEIPSIDWSKLEKYEFEDHTTAIRELACTADSCEV